MYSNICVCHNGSKGDEGRCVTKNAPKLITAYSLSGTSPNYVRLNPDSGCHPNIEGNKDCE